MKNKNKESSTHYECCKCLVYEFHTKGSIICFAGDPSDKLFIIIKGAVNVYIQKEQNAIDSEKQEFQQKLKIYQQFQQQISVHKPLQRSNSIGKLPPNIFMRRQSTLFSVKDNENIQQQNNQPQTNRLSQIFRKAKQIKQNNSQDVTLGFKKIEGVNLGGLIFDDIRKDIELLFEDGIFQYNFVTTLSQGQIFGELGLARKKPRDATVICKEETHFAVINKRDYDKILKSQFKKQIQKKTNFFLQNIFKGLSVDAVTKLSYDVEKVKFPLNHVIYKENSEAIEFFLIKKGLVKLQKEITPEQKTPNINTQNELNPTTKRNASKDKYTQFSITKLSIGESFGEEDLFNNKTYSCTAICISSEVVLYKIKKSQFIKLIQDKKFYELFENRSQIKQQMHRKQQIIAQARIHIENKIFNREMDSMSQQSNSNTIRKNVDNLSKQLSKFRSKVSPHKASMIDKQVQEQFQSVQQTNDTKPSPNQNTSKIFLKKLNILRGVLPSSQSNQQENSLYLWENITEVVKFNNKINKQLQKNQKQINSDQKQIQQNKTNIFKLDTIKSQKLIDSIGINSLEEAFQKTKLFKQQINKKKSLSLSNQKLIKSLRDKVVSADISSTDIILPLYQDSIQSARLNLNTQFDSQIIIKPQKQQLSDTKHSNSLKIIELEPQGFYLNEKIFPQMSLTSRTYSSTQFKDQGTFSNQTPLKKLEDTFTQLTMPKYIQNLLNTQSKQIKHKRTNSGNTAGVQVNINSVKQLFGKDIVNIHKYIRNNLEGVNFLNKQKTK